MSAITAEDLRRVDLFDDVDDGRLEAWVAIAQEVRLGAGETVFTPDREVAGVYVLLEGTARGAIGRGEHAETVSRQVAPTWMGAIAALTGAPLGVTMVTETPCRLALLPAADFRRLTFADEAVHRRVMEVVAPVMTRVSAAGHHRERLESLGTMAAGLAHELNNPAAAARRAAADLAQTLLTVNASVRQFVESGVEREEAGRLLDLQEEAVRRAGGQTAMDALDAADAEDALRDRLEELGVREAWRLAEPLAAAGVDEAWLERVAGLAGPATGAALEWVAATLAARGLAAELAESTRRMSDLIGAMRSYAYLDRGERVAVDLHEGIEATLVVLGHRLKHTRVEVVRDYDRALPKLTVYASELNQVWTNLLANAIDALGGEGTITITTRRDGGCARVDIADDGPGIPPEVRGRIFDPFFTTKDVGSGTGLGLATARQIVAGRHGGSLTVDSEPGRTTFHVWIPL